MWANHDLIDIHPAQRSIRYGVNTLAKGIVSPKAFFEATEYMIRKYFSHPSYWRVNGGLYFSVYMLAGLVEGFGTVEKTRKALDNFRDRVREAGLGELHLNAIVWGQIILPGEKTLTNVNELLDKLGFDSITSYVWIHHNWPSVFPTTSYPDYWKLSVQDYKKFIDMYELPYYPNVTMGWDTSPRTIQSDGYEHVGYPFSPVLVGNTPQEFKKALQYAKEFLDKGLTKPKVLTINAWNEWTEGSYIEPDTVNGMGYLEAIRDVFASKAEKQAANL